MKAGSILATVLVRGKSCGWQATVKQPFQLSLRLRKAHSAVVTAAAASTRSTVVARTSVEKLNDLHRAAIHNGSQATRL